MTTTDKATTALPPTDAHHSEPAPNASLPPQKKRTQRKLYAYLGLITVLMLLTLGASLYALYTEQLLRQQQLTVSQLTTAKLQHLNQHTNDATYKLQQEIHTLNTTVHTTLQQQSTQSDRWLLLEARYYLELAAMNALWSDNLQPATALLQQADTLLTKIHDQRIFGIRQAIAKEIAQNNQYAALDIPGLLSQLDAVQRTVTNLPFKKSVAFVVNQQAASMSTTSPSTWREHLHTSLLQLEKLVVIRHHDEAIQPLLTPAYESMLRENIRLNLQTAQWSLLQRQPAVYQIALKQARENILRGFDTQSPQTQTLIQQLKALMQVSWIQKKPAPSASLAQLNQYIEMQTKPSPSSEMPTKENLPRNVVPAGEPS